MFAIVKAAGLSACLSAGFVSAFDATPTGPQSTVPAAAKVLGERLPEPATVSRVVLASAEGHETGKGSGCAGQAWPYGQAGCAEARPDAPGRPAVRVIRFEGQGGANQSAPTRVPAPATAAR